jgi:hypothetical protein
MWRTYLPKKAAWRAPSGIIETGAKLAEWKRH